MHKEKYTEGQIRFNEFLDAHALDAQGNEYGIMPPLMTDEEALEILRLHFAPDYVSVNPIKDNQFNTELVFHILQTYKGKV
jgi:hypothetical protein